jgi:early secretory antigenic target protein ESAT-6
MSLIQVDYAAMEAAYTQMQSIARGMDEKLDTLRSRLQKMEWDGSDREAYQIHQAKWDTAVRDLNQILNDIGSAVGTANENYQNTETSNAGIWG